MNVEPSLVWYFETLSFAVFPEQDFPLFSRYKLVVPLLGVVPGLRHVFRDELRITIDLDKNSEAFGPN